VRPSKVTRTLFFLAAVSGAALAQTQLAFEVATIKPLGDTISVGARTVPRAQFHYEHPKSTEPLRRITGNRFALPYSTLTDLIIDAYNVRIDQISGQPKWATQDGDMYQINAKAEGDGTPTSDQVRLMLQSLLADRFELKLHHETRSLPAYELTIAKNGPKIKELPEGNKLPSNSARKALLVSLISGFLDHPLVDKTGLAEANYQFDWDTKELIGEITPGTLLAPSIFSSVQEQLGLKLDLKSAPVDFLVIDHAEKPSEN
jgi:uncharacterized protein (TIGR03435 family)